MPKPLNQRTITGNVALRVRGVPVEMTLTVPADPVPPATMLPVLRQMTHTVIDAMVAQAAEEGRSVSCRAGCGACCRQLVPISEIEARQLAELVADLPAERRAEIERRFRAGVRRLENAGLAESLRDAARRGERSLRAIGLEYFELGIDCPFLEENSCSIHPDRPLSCREYLVTSPAENCSRPTAASVRPVPMPARVSNALIALNKPAGSEAAAFIPLILALEWASCHASDSFEITGPELIRKIIESVSGRNIVD